jgi:Ni,Fe-hydrogenase III large subunit
VGVVSQVAGLAPAAVETVAPGGWHDACERALAAGRRFAGLYAVDGPALRAIFAGPGGPHVLACETGDETETIVDLVPAAGWDEREAHDLYGVRFAGHEPLRPLVAHPEALADWTTAVLGNDPHQVAVGPIHAGVIESGHFRFHVVGERILHVDLRLFYKHRGLERAAEGLLLRAGIGHAQRACAACAVANGVAYAQACEQALGLLPEPALADIRTLLLELERLYNHLHDVAAICAGVGFAPGTMVFAALKERAQRLNQRLCGHRFLFHSVAVGRSDVVLDRVDARVARDELRALRVDVRRAWREILFNASVQARLGAVGILDAPAAERLGAVGPAARAAGVGRDVRTESPLLGYEGFEPARPSSPTGDVAARLELRATELEATFELFDALLARPLRGGDALPAFPPASLGVGRVESPRGETVCAVETDGERLARLHLRTGSYANWPALAHAAAGNLLPDFPLVNKSFELCYACSDR